MVVAFDGFESECMGFTDTDFLLSILSNKNTLDYCINILNNYFKYTVEKENEKEINNFDDYLSDLINFDDSLVYFIKKISDNKIKKYY